MTDHTPLKPWKILRNGAIAIGMVFALLWLALSLLFPSKISKQLEGFLLDPENEMKKVEAVELSFEGEWNPRLVQAFCGEKSYYEYSGELTIRKNGTEEKVSVMADPQDNVYKGWRDILCMTNSGSLGKPITLWGKTVGPLVICQENDGMIVTSLTDSDGERLLFVCAEHSLTDEDLAQAFRRWEGLD